MDEQQKIKLLLQNREEAAVNKQILLQKQMEKQLNSL
jgi:hypothetical protein